MAGDAGLDLARAIKGQSASQPIMLVTAYAESVSMGEDRLANIDFLMGKPFSLTQLQEGLEKIFPAA